MVSLFRMRPANNTLKTSAIMFTNRHAVKMIIRSRSVCVVAKAVALTNQKSNTLGFSVLIRNPEANI